MSNLFLSLLILSIFILASCNSKTDSSNNQSTEETDVSADPKADSEETTKANVPKEASEKKAAFAYGIDISKYQGDEVALMDHHKDSLHFIICKATEGVTYTDPKFIQNWKLIPEKGFIRGSYHFYRSADDPKKQADNYLRAIENLEAKNRNFD